MRNFLARLILVMACLGGAAGIVAYTAKAQGGAGAMVVATCGTLGQAFAVGSTRTLTVNINGQVCQ